MTGEQSAPAKTADRASEPAADDVFVADRVPRPWKQRFMQATLGKLKRSDVVDSSTQSLAATQADAGPPPRPERRIDPSATPMTYTYPPGSTPLDRYTIRRGVGVGGFGEVYFAVSEAGKEVALKRIQRNLEIELRGVSQCLNLKHPNLVALYDVCRDGDDQSWVVMEYVAGPNLRRVLDDAPGGLPIEEVHRWFTGVAAGVGHLHASGLVHRDLKPGNLFDDDGVVKVGDYGLSKFISSSRRGGQTESVGTFHYMAPEIGRGEYGREIDIYALGVILYELITGEVPFDGESCQEIIVKHLTASPSLTAVATPYRRVIERCLRKDPAKRYPTVEAMLADLPVLGTDAPGQAGTAKSTSERPVDAPEQRSFTSSRGFHETTRRHHRPYGRAAAGGGPVVVSPAPEPIAAAVSSSWQDFKLWWRTLDRSPAVKGVLFACLAVVLVVNTGWLLPLASVFAMVYVPYYVIRQMVLHAHWQPSYAEAQKLAATAPPPPKPLTRAQWRNRMRSDLRAKRSIERIAELSTSWTAATVAALVMGAIAAMIGLRNGQFSPTAVAPFFWSVAMVILTATTLLGLGKFWERGEGETLTRRIVSGAAGFGIGMAGYMLAQFLAISVTEGLGRDIDETMLSPVLYTPGPTAAAFGVHFAGLLAGLRWWRYVDPLRRKRLSLFAVAVAVVGEWGLHQFLPIPQPLGMITVAGVAMATQLSAPWINPLETRPRLPQQTTDPQSAEYVA